MPDFVNTWNDASDLHLLAEIEHVYQEFCSRLTALLGQPDETGYSAQVITSCVALYVEFESRFAAYVPAARKFDIENTGAASKRLAALSVEFRQRLKEASYLAAFKVVYEKFAAYVTALPAALPPNAPLSQLTACEARLVEFQHCFHGFEPRAAELAAEGILPSMGEKWLTPLVEVTQRHIDAIRKRCDEQRNSDRPELPGSLKRAEFPFKNLEEAMKYFDDQRKAEELGSQKSVVSTNPVQMTGQQQIDAFNTSYREMRAAVNAINAQIDAGRGNISFDNSPLYSSVYDHYQRFLNRIAQLEAAAKELAAQGQPQLMQSMQAQKADVEKACEIIKQMLGAQQANNMDLLGKAAGMQKDWWNHHEEMRRMQQQITDSINSYKP
jgi:hypothetical protein